VKNDCYSGFVLMKINPLVSFDKDQRCAQKRFYIFVPSDLDL